MENKKVILTQAVQFEVETVLGKMVNCKLYCCGTKSENNRQRFLIIGKQVFKVRFLSERKKIGHGYHDATLCLTRWWLCVPQGTPESSKKWADPLIELWFRDGKHSYLHRLGLFEEAEEMEYADLVAEML